MVQLRPDHRYLPRKHYWKLIRPKGHINADLIRMIRTASGFDGSHLLRDHLCKLFIRVQRGLPIYEKYLDGDLVKFCIARQLHIRSFKRDKLINRLADADERLVFKRFLDLPPEIRIEIFEIYMASLERKAYSEPPPPPPITVVSKVIRRESLPVFASHFVEKTRRFSCWVRSSDTPGPDDTAPIGMSDDTQAFWSDAPEAFIPHVKRLQIVGPVIGIWRIDISAEASDRRLIFEPDFTTASNSIGLKASEAVTNALQKMVEDIDARQRPVFRREDAQRILNAFEMALDLIRQEVASRGTWAQYAYSHITKLDEK
ncbi:hypothetical protein HII31_10566 [Pseudocercospora fuligena]|uniref:Uncharacterized protein n=1 Tax=Pseudocercospora fuligena TaxID=685502 RepID=A0A8H6RCT0_9PEZI|nr:hypothetical protein HII31_10566 [Pseudocercospora fuligena]